MELEIIRANFKTMRTVDGTGRRLTDDEIAKQQASPWRGSFYMKLSLKGRRILTFKTIVLERKGQLVPIVIQTSETEQIIELDDAIIEAAKGLALEGMKRGSIGAVAAVEL